MARVASLLPGLLVCAWTAIATAQPAADDMIDKKIAVWRFDALGIEPEIVTRLETLFRKELERLNKTPLPGPRDIQRKITEAEQQCTGEEKCLTSIGKKVGVDFVVTGLVGQLGDAYVLNIKVVDVATAKSQKIQSDPLRGSPDELIEGVRVAAYRLLAPQNIHGALQIQTDLVGAEVTLDGKSLGKTPLANNGVVAKLALGKHKLRVEAKGYDPFDSDVDVNFQKVSPVVVRLLQSSETTGTGRVIEKERSPIYTRPWFLGTALGVAIVAGYLVGRVTGHIKFCTFESGGGGRPSCD